MHAKEGIERERQRTGVGVDPVYRELLPRAPAGWEFASYVAGERLEAALRTIELYAPSSRSLTGKEAAVYDAALAVVAEALGAK